MSSNPNDLRQIIQELISRSASDQLQNLHRFEELVRQATRGDLDGTALREEYLRFAREEGLRYFNDLTRVGLSFYHSLIELNRHYNERFFEHIAAPDSPRNGASENGSRRVRIVEMELQGPLGRDARRAFVIENQRDEPVAVSFLISEFTDESGEANFRPPLQLAPARFDLNPGEERQVLLTLPLLEEFFVPGQVYSATLVASGFEGLQLHLKARASAAASEPEQPDEPESESAKGPVFRPVEAEEE